MPGPERTARHPWRMMLALVIASAAFFLDQQKAFPAAIKGRAVWFAPPLFALIGLGYWTVKTRHARRRAHHRNLHTKAALP